MRFKTVERPMTQGVVVADALLKAVLATVKSGKAVVVDADADTYYKLQARLRSKVWDYGCKLSYRYSAADEKMLIWAQQDDRATRNPSPLPIPTQH